MGWHLLLPRDMRRLFWVGTGLVLFFALTPLALRQTEQYAEFKTAFGTIDSLKRLHFLVEVYFFGSSIWDNSLICTVPIGFSHAAGARVLL